MQLTLERDQIVPKLDLLQTVANTRTTLPILNNVLVQAIEAEEDNEEGISQIILTANNLEMAVGVSVPAIVIEPGITTILAKKLYEVIREIPTGTTFELSVDTKNYISINYRGGSYRLRGLDPEEFPAQPEIEETPNTIEASDLRDILENTLFAASLEEVRYYLNAVLLVLNSNETVAVSTDGRRFALAEAPAVTRTETEQEKVIIPLKTAREIVKIFASSKEISFSIIKGQIALTDGDSILTARLIEGDYPDYNQIIPEKQPHNVEIHKDSLVSAVRRVSLLADPKNYSIQLTIEGSTAKLEVETPDFGFAEGFVDLKEAFEGTPIAFKFDARLLIDGLSQIKTEYATLEFEKSNRVVLLGPSNRDANNYFNLLMPIRLEDEEDEEDEDEPNVQDSVTSEEQEPEVDLPEKPEEESEEGSEEELGEGESQQF